VVRDVFLVRVTDSETSQHSAADDEAESTFAVGAEHHSCANHENDGPYEERLPSTHMITRYVGSEGTKEGTGLVDGNNIRLCQGNLSRGHELVAKAKLCDKGWQGQSGSDESRVIADLEENQHEAQKMRNH
jgi:hypothetical protein